MHVSAEARGVSGALETELQAVMSRHLVAEHQTRDFWVDSKHSELLKHLHAHDRGSFEYTTEDS